jgi:hypothetical protein
MKILCAWCIYNSKFENEQEICQLSIERCAIFFSCSASLSVSSLDSYNSTWLSLSYSDFSFFLGSKDSVPIMQPWLSFSKCPYQPLSLASSTLATQLLLFFGNLFWDFNLEMLMEAKPLNTLSSKHYFHIQWGLSTRLGR